MKKIGDGLYIQDPYGIFVKRKKSRALRTKKVKGLRSCKAKKKA